MIKDLFHNLIKEIQDEKNQEVLYLVLEPLTNKLKFSYYMIVFLLLLMVANLIYSNTLLSEIIKHSKQVAP